MNLTYWQAPVTRVPRNRGQAILGLILLFSLIGLAPGGAAVRLGSETLASDGFRVLRGKRVGLITNPSGLNRRQESTIQILRRAKDVRLVALFAAEHGLRGHLPAGQEFPDATDPGTGLPVFSLYGPGPTRKPRPAMLQQLDALVYDVQDTGCRSYTFITTMGLAMEACAETGKEFVVLDRPNPLGGLRVEGPRLDPRFRSHIGQWEVPYIYGLTCGELAYMINQERWIQKPCRLTIVRMSGWRRGMVWRHTGLTWIPTSPNIPRGDSPLYYPATGLLGAIGGVYIGIGQTRPFEVVAAPWLDAQRLSRRLNRTPGLPGLSFQPYSVMHRQQLHQGVRLVFNDPVNAPLMAVNFHLMEAIRATSGHDLFAEFMKSGRSYALLDKAAGTDAIRLALEAKTSAAALAKSWKPDEAAFRLKRKKYLLYPE